MPEPFEVECSNTFVAAEIIPATSLKLAGTTSVLPDWANVLTHTTSIGNHRFYHARDLASLAR